MFEKLLSTLAEALKKNNIPYMVIGGQALLQYGQPRLTEDIDITIGLSCEKSSELKKILKTIPLDPLKEATDKFIRSTNVLPCLDSATGIRVDFIFSFLPYEKEAIQRGNKIKIGVTWVHFAAPEDLIIHKMFAGRPRDLEDVKSILMRQGKKLNTTLIQAQLAELSRLEGYQELQKNFKKLLSSIRK